jgi:hypothetical protein
MEREDVVKIVRFKIERFAEESLEIEMEHSKSETLRVREKKISEILEGIWKMFVNSESELHVPE